MGDTTNRRWLITGVSSGLGRALATHVLARGDTVIGTLRQTHQLTDFAALAPGRAIPLKLDVTDDAIGPPINDVIGKLGGIDIVVNNAGYALIGAIEDISLAEARQQIETNVMGTFKVIQAVLPHLRRQGRGHIINVASVAGAKGIPLYGLYCTSKFAVVGLSAALAQEVRAFGIFVTALEPGGFRTHFGDSSMKTPAKMSAPYEEKTKAMAAYMTSFGKTAANDPAKGAAAIVALTEMPDPPVHVALGADGLSHVEGALRARLEDYARAAAVLPPTVAD